MQNVSVTTAVTTILPAGPRSDGNYIIQNQSDTTMYLAIGTVNAALLTSSLGLILEAGDTIILGTGSASQLISAIHGGSGSKTAHWQRV